MKPSDVADLLVLDSALNRYASASNTSAEKAVAWATVLNQFAPGMTPGEARELIVEHYGESSDSLTPSALVDAWKHRKRLLPRQIRADVRSARARGIVSADWPETRPLPDDVQARLESARASYRVAVESGGEFLQLEVGKRV